MILYHPGLDRDHDFVSEKAANIARRSGWTDPPQMSEHDPDDSAAAEFPVPDDPPQQEE
jgi:hypothetical protein